MKTGNNAPGIHEVKVQPAILQQRWLVDSGAGDLRILYPGQTTPDLCKKIHAQHKQDETKFPKVMTKAASKKEGHTYNDNPDKAKSDCDALEVLVTPHQMSDDMTGLKDALIAIEDFMPGNSAAVNASVIKVLGTFKCLTEGEDGVMELSLKEKGETAARKMLDPTKKTQIAEKKEEVLNTAVKGGVGTLCKAMGTTQQELLPDLQASLDAANGKKPLTESTTYNKLEIWKEKCGSGEPKPDEEIAKEKLDKIKAQVEADKKTEAELREKDKDMKAMIATAKEKLTARIEFARNATKAAEESALKNGTLVLARWKTFGYYEGKVNGSIKTVEGKKVINIAFDDGDNDDVEIQYVAIDPAVKCAESDIQVGQKVRAKFFGNKVYENGLVNAKNADGTYEIQYDPIYTDSTVKLDDIKPLHDVGTMSSQGFIVPKSFYNVSFTWLQADEDLDIDFRIWREGSEEADRVQVCFFFFFCIVFVMFYIFVINENTNTIKIVSQDESLHKEEKDERWK